MRIKFLIVLPLCGTLIGCESETGAPQPPDPMPRVAPEPPVPLLAVAIRIIPGPSVTMPPGSWAQFRATPVDTDGRPVPGLPNVTWASSDTARLPVDSLGVVTGKAVVVDALITASLQLDGRVLFGNARVSVIPRDASTPAR
jgi:hypothetical protein